MTTPQSNNLSPQATTAPKPVGYKLLDSDYKSIGNPSAVRSRFTRYFLSSLDRIESLENLLRDTIYASEVDHVYSLEEQKVRAAYERRGNTNQQQQTHILHSQLSNRFGDSSSAHSTHTKKDFSFTLDLFSFHTYDPILSNLLLRFSKQLLPIAVEAVINAQEILLKIGRVAAINEFKGLAFDSSSIAQKEGNGQEPPPQQQQQQHISNYEGFTVKGRAASSSDPAFLARNNNINNNIPNNQSTLANSSSQNDGRLSIVRPSDSQGSSSSQNSTFGNINFISTRLHIRLFHLPDYACIPTLSMLGSSQINSIIQVSGTVVRSSSVHMIEQSRSYKCLNKKCQGVWSIYSDKEQEGNCFDVPSFCPCILPTSCPEDEEIRCKSTKFAAEISNNVTTDYQEVKIQESVTRLGVGSIPRSLTLILEHDLVNLLNPGDEVKVVGKLIARWAPVVEEVRANVKMALCVNSVKIENAEDENWEGVGSSRPSNTEGENATDENGNVVQQASSSFGCREDLRIEFANFWNDPINKQRPIAARNFICKAVCPKLYGLQSLKLALLLTVIGGVGEEEHISSAEEYNDGKRDADAMSVSGSSEEPMDLTKDSGSAPHRAGKKPKVTAPIKFWDAENDTTNYNSSDGQQQHNGQHHQQQQQQHQRQKTPKSTMRRRAQSHMLLVGDPGTGKSQFLRFAAALSPRSVLTTGVGTTSAGLTCSAVRDVGRSGSEWTLEAGALVLADRGVCCIDEFGCIQEKDRTAIHEAMEQQSLSVAKAGLVCKLNCRATVLATTNPRGTYDTDATLTKNTGIGSPLLSRFDLIFVMLDSSDCERDSNVANHLLNDAIRGNQFEVTKGGVPGSNGGSNFKQIWNMEKLRGYIANSKEAYKPVLSCGAAEILKGHYSLCRRNANSSPVTVRALESLVRLSQAHARLMNHDVVTVEDAGAIVMLMESSALCSGGLEGRRNDLFDDCMNCEFPMEEEADVEFKARMEIVIKRYITGGGIGGDGGNSFTSNDGNNSYGGNSYWNENSLGGICNNNVGGGDNFEGGNFSGQYNGGTDVSSITEGHGSQRQPRQQLQTQQQQEWGKYDTEPNQRRGRRTAD